MTSTTNSIGRAANGRSSLRAFQNPSLCYCLIIEPPANLFSINLIITTTMAAGAVSSITIAGASQSANLSMRALMVAVVVKVYSTLLWG